MVDYTLLAIDGVELIYSARGITMTLTPIEQAKQFARTCRGKMIDISVPQFKQYKITVSCTDLEVPPLTDIWPGDIKTFTCIPGLGSGGTQSDEILTIVGMVTDWDTSREEWEARGTWKLEAEQVEAAEES